VRKQTVPSVAPVIVAVESGGPGEVVFPPAPLRAPVVAGGSVPYLVAFHGHPPSVAEKGRDLSRGELLLKAPCLYHVIGVVLILDPYEHPCHLLEKGWSER